MGQKRVERERVMVEWVRSPPLIKGNDMMNRMEWNRPFHWEDVDSHLKWLEANPVSHLFISIEKKTDEPSSSTIAKLTKKKKVTFTLGWMNVCDRWNKKEKKSKTSLVFQRCLCVGKCSARGKLSRLAGRLMGGFIPATSSLTVQK